MITLNGLKIVPTVFPDKTSQVWHLPDSVLADVYKDNEAIIGWQFESEAELIQVAQLKTLLDSYCEIVNLDMPYLPYGRQDKRVDNESTFALKTFSVLINALNFNEVRVLDAHNNSRAQMIRGLEDRSAKNYIADVAGAVKADALLFPDAGAKLRYAAYCIAPAVCATKIRDQETGKISGVRIDGKVSGKRILIVDDICDGGATFVALAGAAKGAKEISLYVTHGIFSRGLEPLREAGIGRIFTHKGEVK